MTRRCVSTVLPHAKHSATEDRHGRNHSNRTPKSWLYRNLYKRSCHPVIQFLSQLQLCQSEASWPASKHIRQDSQVEHSLPMLSPRLWHSLSHSVEDLEAYFWYVKGPVSSSLFWLCLLVWDRVLCSLCFSQTQYVTKEHLELPTPLPPPSRITGMCPHMRSVHITLE